MIAFTHKPHPRARNIKITVKPDSTVVVSSPPRTSKKTIQSFVESQENWIKRTQEKYQKNTLTKDTEVLIFGKKYQKSIQFSSQKPTGISIQQKSLVLNPLAPTTSWTTSEKKQLDRFLKSTARKYLLPRTEQLAKKMHITVKKITLKELSSRWGSCSSKGNLNFNWRLVHCPPTVIDYVIIHELAHRVHMDHSARFWALVAKYDSQYKIHRQWLKKHGMQLS